MERNEKKKKKKKKKKKTVNQIQILNVFLSFSCFRSITLHCGGLGALVSSQFEQFHKGAAHERGEFKSIIRFDDNHGWGNYLFFFLFFFLNIFFSIFFFFFFLHENCMSWGRSRGWPNMCSHGDALPWALVSCCRYQSRPHLSVELDPAALPRAGPRTSTHLTPFWANRNWTLICTCGLWVDHIYR